MTDDNINFFDVDFYTLISIAGGLQDDGRPMEADALVKSAADVGNPAGDLARVYLMIIRNESGEAAEAGVQILRKYAMQDNAIAQNLLGTGYLVGMLGIERSESRATYWLVRSARNGESDLNLAPAIAVLFIQGRGVPQDRAKAIELLRASARAGNMKSACLLGVLLLDIDQREIDHEPNPTPAQFREGKHWLFHAAKKGNINAQYSLASAYSSGIWLPRDAAKADHWFHLAVSSDRPDIIINYARFLASDEAGRFRDKPKAIELLKDVAHAGNVEANFELGYQYYFENIGANVLDAFSEGFRYLARAALDGHAAAYAVFARYDKDMYEETECREYLSRAWGETLLARHYDPNFRHPNIGKLYRQLTPEERREGRHHARIFGDELLELAHLDQRVSKLVH